MQEEKKTEEVNQLMEKRANMLASFLGNQRESDYFRINKITYQFLGNAVEDYIVVSLFEKEKLLATFSNLLGLEHLDGFPEELARRLFEFAFSNYMELLDFEHNTNFEVNFSIE